MKKILIAAFIIFTLVALVEIAYLFGLSHGINNEKQTSVLIQKETPKTSKLSYKNPGRSALDQLLRKDSLINFDSSAMESKINNPI